MFYRFTLTLVAIASLTACESIRPYAAAPAPVVTVAAPKLATVIGAVTSAQILSAIASKLIWMRRSKRWALWRSLYAKPKG